MIKTIKIFIFQNPKSKYSISIFDKNINANDIVFFNSDFGFKIYDLDPSVSINIPIKINNQLNELDYDEFNSNNENLLKSLMNTPEIKRGYLNHEQLNKLVCWLYHEVKRFFDHDNIEIICFNKRCLIPLAMTKILTQNVNQACKITIKDTEIDNFKKGCLKFEEIVINNTETAISVSSKKHVVSKKRIYMTYIYLIFRLVLQGGRNCYISPNFSYLADRLSGTLLNKLTVLITSRDTLKRKDGFSCQIADDTSLDMTVAEYKSIIKNWCINNGDNKVLFIHPKERSLKSLLFYFGLAWKFNVKLYFGGIDKLFKFKDGSLALNKVLYISSTSAHKYKDVINFEKFN